MRRSTGPTLAEALDECCRRVAAGESPEACFPDFPTAYREELARLIPLAAPLRGLGRDPAPDYVARLEARLRSAPLEKRPRPWDAFFRALSPAPAMRLALPVLLAAVLLGGGGVVAAQAAENSLPDSPLYGIKTARESVEVALARDPEAQVSVQSRQSANRARELERAARAGKAEAVAQIISRRLESSVERMVDEALSAPPRVRRQAAPRALQAVRSLEREIQRVQDVTGPEVRPYLERLDRFLRGQERRLQEALPAARL